MCWRGSIAEGRQSGFRVRQNRDYTELPRVSSRLDNRRRPRPEGRAEGIMRTTSTAAPRNEKFFHLVGDIRSDLTELIRKEVALAKTEMGEKFREIARNAAFMAAGGVVGLMAAFLLFLGIGAIVALALTSAGMAPGAAYFASYGGLGLVLALAAWLLVQKAMHAFRNFSLKPDKAIETVKGPEATATSGSKKIEIEHLRPDSEELQSDVVITRARVDEEMSELKQRLKPGYMGRSTVAGIKHHPLRALLITAGAGLGGYLLWKQNHPNGAPRRPLGAKGKFYYWLGRLKAAKA